MLILTSCLTFFSLLPFVIRVSANKDLLSSFQELPYDQLMQELDVTNVRELEDFLINECMYVVSISAHSLELLEVSWTKVYCRN